MGMQFDPFATLLGQATGGDAPPWLVFAIIGGFLVVFPIFWCSIVWLLSRFGGWHRLAERYDARDRTASGRCHRAVTGMVGGTSYRNTLTVHLDDDGFFLEVNPLFRVGHPRLFIPWSEISDRTPRKVFWWSAERLSVGRPKVGTVTLPTEVLSESPLGSARK